MLTLDSHPTGRHFLQIPGPSPVPDRILRAMSLPTIDHRGPEFGALGLKVLDGHAQDLQDAPAGGHLSGLGHRRVGSGAGQHAEPRRHVLMYETGHFAALWQKMAQRLGLQARVPAAGTDAHLPNAPAGARRAGAA